MRQTEASLARQNVSLTTSRDSSSHFSLPVRASTRPSSAASVSLRTRLPKCHDKTFREDVLSRYGVVFRQPLADHTPYLHFGTTDPETSGFGQKISEWYQRQHTGCDVWLDLKSQNISRVARQYQNMATINSKEAKFAHKSKTLFLQEEDFSDLDEDAEGVSTYLEFEWTSNPDGQIMCCPPTVTEREPNYNFKVSPDCTFWLTSSGMGLRSAQGLQSYTFMLPEIAAVAPYLTVEFKKDDLSSEAAENKVAVISSLVLYNHFRLRCTRLHASGQWEPDSFDDMRHYGIVFNRCNVVIYMAKPCISFQKSQGQLQDTWAGCKLDELTQKDVRKPNDIHEIQQWINEIHHWALDHHRQQFVTDLKGTIGVPDIEAVFQLTMGDGDAVMT